MSNTDTIGKVGWRRVWRYQRGNHNGRNKKYKRTNNDLQNTRIKLQIPTNPTKTRGWTQVLVKCCSVRVVHKQFLDLCFAFLSHICFRTYNQLRN